MLDCIESYDWFTGKTSFLEIFLNQLSFFLYCGVSEVFGNKMAKKSEESVSDLEKMVAETTRKPISEVRKIYAKGKRKGILQGALYAVAVAAITSGGFLAAKFIDTLPTSLKNQGIERKLPKKLGLVKTIDDLNLVLALKKDDSDGRKKEVILAFQEQSNYNFGLKVPMTGKPNPETYAAANHVRSTIKLTKNFYDGMKTHDWVNHTILGHQIRIPKIAIEKTKEFSLRHPKLDVIIDYKDPIIQKVAKNLTLGLKIEEKADKIRKFVQAMPYNHDVHENGYAKHPVQTLGDGGGDCEDQNGLYINLAKAVGLDVLLLDFPKHYMASVAGNFEKEGFFMKTTNPDNNAEDPKKKTEKKDWYVEHKGKKYFYVDTVSERKIGDCSEEFRNIKPKIIEID